MPNIQKTKRSFFAFLENVGAQILTYKDVYYMFLFFSRTGLAGVKRKALANELLGEFPEVLSRIVCYKKLIEIRV
jgi:hypothetical protein